jgi:hypothetical protein
MGEEKKGFVNEKGCMGCGWIFVIPLGCLTVFVLFAAMFALIFVLAMYSVKSSEGYKDAIVHVKNAPIVEEALGKPVETGYFPQGSVEYENGRQTVNLSIPVSGPKGKGVLYVVGEKDGTSWTYSKMEIKLDNSKETLNLLDK